jgi:hypothetical protein
VLTRSADGARGYPGRLTADELAGKFSACASRTLTRPAADAAWSALERLEQIADVRELTALVASSH